MDKFRAFLKFVLALIFLAVCASSVALGIYGYRKFGADRARLVTKDAEIEKLNHAELELKQAVADAGDRQKAIEEENDRLKKQADLTEGQKKVILNQVRSSVDSFESFRTQATDEINRLRSSITALDADKRALSDRITAAENVSKEDKDKMQSQVQDLGKQIEDHKLAEARLRSNVRKKDKAAIVKDSAKLHYNLGNFYFRGRNFLEAAREYQKALFYQPNDPEANFNLAVVSDEALDDYVTALEHYKKYLAVSPGAKNAVEISERVLDLEIKQKVTIDGTKVYPAKDAIKSEEKGTLAHFDMAADKK